MNEDLKEGEMKNEDEWSETRMKKKTISDSSMEMMLKKKKEESPHSMKET